MTYRAIIRPPAEADFLAAREWYEDNAPEQVDRLISDFEAALSRICKHPHVPAVLRPRARMSALSVFPYQLWYYCHDDAEVIEVIAVVHTRQNRSHFNDRLRDLP